MAKPYLEWVVESTIHIGCFLFLNEAALERVHELEFLLVFAHIAIDILTFDHHVVLLQGEVLRILQVYVALEGLRSLRQFS